MDEMTVKEASLVLDVSVDNVLHLVKSGRSPARRIGSHTFLIEADAVYRRRDIGSCSWTTRRTSRTAWAIMHLAEGHALPVLLNEDRRQTVQ